MTTPSRRPAKITSFLTSERIRAWASMLFAAELIFLVVGILVTHDVIGSGAGKATQSDFVSFYSAGTLANAGHASQAYDQESLYKTEQSITHAGAPRIWFFYPPVYLVLCRIFAIPSYLLSYYLCAIAGLGLYLWTAARIWPDQRLPAIIVAACLPSTFLCLGIGQNAFLSATLFGLGLTLLKRNQVIAGFVLALLCYKPHFGLLLPVALICARQWRAFASATLGVSVCILATISMFGPEIWIDYEHATIIAAQTFRNSVVPAYNLVNLYATCLSLGLPDSTAHLVQGIAFLFAAFAVGKTWSMRCPQDLRYATLVAATIVAMPVVLFYDLVSLSLAGFWLTRDMTRRGAPNWEYATLVLIPVLYIPLYALCLRTHISCGAIIPLIILGMTLRRTPLRQAASQP